MNLRNKTLDTLLMAMDETDSVFSYEPKFGNNCEWCGRIRVAKKCECKMDREARMIARRFR